jgi:outer membrane receptor protein involved in Fe transport
MGGRNTRMTRVSMIISLLALASSARGQSSVSATVTDKNGAVVIGASVRCKGGREVLAKTDESGSFVTNNDRCRSGRFTVEATGFASADFSAEASQTSVIILKPALIDPMVTVTGTGTPRSESIASVLVISSQALDRSPSPAIDDRLRQVPGFTLFRRTGSRTANPTSQGVSLRGVGASGASRALVLKDGIPLNDPFGSWVYWGRAVNESVSEVEILRGPAGDIYGTAAIGGVVSINTLLPDKREFASFDGSFGSESAAYISMFSSFARRSFRGSLAGEAFRTDGYVPVEPGSRGSVDTPANVRRSTVQPVVEFSPGTKFRIFGSGEFYREVRENGTPLQANDTKLNTYSAGLDLATERIGSFTARIYAGREFYHQSFSAIAADRESETLTRLQTVPSRVSGIRVQWTYGRSANSFFAGTEIRRVTGRSDEIGYSGGLATSTSASGGRENTLGLFAGASLRSGSRTVIALGVRYDQWRDQHGISRTQSLSSPASTDVRFPDRSESAFSPRLGVIARITGNISLTASTARSFRQATLNELYRSFRLGNVLTLANASLAAERGTNIEGGLTVNSFHDRLYIRTGPYCTWINGPVSNITLSSTPSLITRQRQNLGKTRSCGLEADLELRASPDISFSAGYLHAASTVIDGGGTTLAGLQLPQIPRDQFNFQAVYSKVKFGTLSLQVRGSGRQFEDDLNTLELKGFMAADLFYSHALSDRFTIYAAVENLTDTAIQAGRSPVVTLGQPRTARIGIRFRYKE